jgi:hypothetical protein
MPILRSGLFGPTMKSRPIFRDDFAGRGQRVTGVDLRRSHVAILARRIGAQWMDGLDCSRGELSEQFHQVRAAMHAAETSAQFRAKSGLDAQTEQTLEVRRYRRARPMRPSIDAGVDAEDQQRVVDGDAQRHVMKQAPSLHRAMIVVHGVALPVRQSRFDIPQTVGPTVSATDDLTRVHRRAESSRW